MTEIGRHFEKAPKGGQGWVNLGYEPRSKATVWHRGRLRVLSSLMEMDLPGGSGKGLTWHISVSESGKRPKPNLLNRALRDFGMVGAEEDNHHPGVARHFFMPVDPAKRVDCECKTTEETIVEPDGYRWTNPKPESGEACRGCDTKRIHGTPCPIHGLPTPTAIIDTDGEATT